MRRFLHMHWLFLLLSILFIAGGAVVLTQIHKGDFVFWFSMHRTYFLNRFFRIYTSIGGGAGVTLLILAFLFYKKRFFIMLAASNLVVGGLVQYLKHSVFDYVYRPLLFFQDVGRELDLVPGITVHGHYSFPSGHAAGAFAFFGTLALLYHRKWFTFGCFLLASLVAVSRMYLSQHFFVDTYFGMMGGLIITLIIYVIFNSQAWFHTKWADTPFIKLPFFMDRKEEIEEREIHEEDTEG